MKISILASISAKNEDNRSMKITQIGELCYILIRNMHDSTYLIFVYHEGEPMRTYEFSTGIKKMQLTRFITDI